MTLRLTVRQLEPTDYGDYQCVGGNQLGRTHKTITLYGTSPAVACVLPTAYNSTTVRFQTRDYYGTLIESHAPRASRLVGYHRRAASCCTSRRFESSLDVCSRRRTRCIQSQQHRTTVHDTDSCRLSSAGTEERVLSWRLNEDSGSSDDWRAVGSQFQVLGPKSKRSIAALASRRPSPGQQESPGDCRARLAMTARRSRRHTEVAATWRTRQ